LGLEAVTNEQPPIIDISGLCEGEPHALERVARDLPPACAEWGAFLISGHGVPPERLVRFDGAMRALFDLEPEAKATLRRTRENARGYYDEELTKNRPDWKEVFDYGAEHDAGAAGSEHSDGVNQWPADMPRIRDELLDHYDRCERIGLALLRALCASLGLAADTLTTAFEEHSSFVRLNRYAPCPEPAPAEAPLFPECGHLGVHHHTDAGALTVLFQDDVAGLQVMKGDRFMVVEPVPNTFVINLGDMLQVWSNDRYRSPIHRVLTNSESTRHSAPFFLNPGYDTICAPLSGILRAGERVHYSPISWSHFRDQRSAGDYADYGHEIQISDFRLD